MEELLWGLDPITETFCLALFHPRLHLTLHPAQQTLVTAHCTRHTLHFTMHTQHTAHCTLVTEYCTLNTEHWSQQTVHCTLHTAHCTIHSSHCTSLSSFCPFLGQVCDLQVYHSRSNLTMLRIVFSCLQNSTTVFTRVTMLTVFPSYSSWILSTLLCSCSLFQIGPWTGWLWAPRILHTSVVLGHWS